MVALTFSPGTGIAGSTIVGEYLQKGKAPILGGVLGYSNSMHAEDGSWETLEEQGNPGPGDKGNPKKYKPGTITVVIGYSKSDYHFVKKVGYQLKAGATPRILPLCSVKFGTRSMACATVAATLGVRGT
jgi:hypothetical protein